MTLAVINAASLVIFSAPSVEVCRRVGLARFGQCSIHYAFNYAEAHTYPLQPSYCQKWCFAPELGGDLVNCFYLDSIFEFHSSNYLRKVVEAA